MDAGETEAVQVRRPARIPEERGACHRAQVHAVGVATLLKEPASWQGGRRTKTRIIAPIVSGCFQPRTAQRPRRWRRRPRPPAVRAAARAEAQRCLRAAPRAGRGGACRAGWASTPLGGYPAAFGRPLLGYSTLPVMSLLMGMFVTSGEKLIFGIARGLFRAAGAFFGSSDDREPEGEVRKVSEER